MSHSILIAPDKFKGTLRAKQVAMAIAEGFPAGVNTRVVPLADGGEGSIEALEAAGFEVITLEVAGTAQTPRLKKIARRQETYFIEAAEFCGLGDSTPDPMGASTFDVGVALKRALDMGARSVVLGVGGTSSTDGGVGFLLALGAKFFSADGEPIPFGGKGLKSLAKVDLTELDSRLAQTSITLASDVDAPLLGPAGAARRFAGQKGANAREVEELEAALGRLVSILRTTTNPWQMDALKVSQAAGAGAGGGLGYAALLLGGQRVAGADFILDRLNVNSLLPQFAMVITGEGCLDEQSLAGKLPVALAKRAKALGIPVIAIVGSCSLDAAELLKVGITNTYSLSQRDRNCAHDAELSAELLTSISKEISVQFN